MREVEEFNVFKHAEKMGITKLEDRSKEIHVNRPTTMLEGLLKKKIIVNPHQLLSNAKVSC